MWIITKHNGIFNTDNMVRIDNQFGATMATIAGERIMISSKPVTRIIIDALQVGKDFVEVE